ncbi:phage tail spike protein [Streptococcus suis]|uniref:phage tail spike protein n=1 Tax=Streptococcus suis TaxID=1307 RepID=UPI0003F6768F|nr:phage tail spike protein [Streptococcus suis]
MISLKDKNVLLVNAFDDEIEQEGNGKYQLSFKYPTSDQRWKNIELADLLLADDLHGEQEFRVFEIVKRNGYIFVYANQVVDDLNSYSISNISVDRVNGQTVMQALAGSIIRKHPFAFYSDIQDRHVFNQKNISVMGALANGKHSIIGQWGGDLVRDKYNVNLLKRGGRESEALFMYKKNLKSYAETNSIKGLFTRLNLSVKNSDIKTTVDSPLIGSYGGRVYELNVEVADQYVATLEQLQEYGRNYFAEKLIDVPNNSLTISVTDSQEYDVRIFDTVFVHHEIFDKDLRMKITSYRFSPMGRKLKSIGFGKIKTSLTQQVSNIATEVVEQSVSVAGQVFEEKLQKEIENADKVIDGKINKVRDEINDGIEQSRAEAERHADNIKRSIDTEIAQVNTSMQAQAQEHDRQVADILSKTQSIESLANQAKSDAASALARANQVKTEAIADARVQVATVSQALNTAKSELQTAIASADQKARDSQASATALRNDLNLQASKILEQARAQTALTNRVSTVETLADGTRSTVAELSKTVSKATGDITSVSSRTKTVEDTLSQTRTQYEALTQTVNTQTGQIESINRKTADLQSGIDGVREKFENLRVGGINLLTDTDEETVYISKNPAAMEFLRSPYDLAKVFDKHGLVTYTLSLDLKAEKDGAVRVYMQNGSGSRYGGLYTYIGVTTEWKRYHVTFTPTEGNMELSESFLAFYGVYGTGVVPYARKFKLEKGTVPTDWSPATEDLRSEIASYKRTADEASAELSRQIQLADGKAVEAKTYAQQTAEGFKTRLESLETYKNAEGTRASQYFTASRDETARQVSALRVAVTQDYVAKSVFEETARGISQRFESLYVGGTNLLTGTDEYTEIFNSEQSHAEFLRTPYDLAPVFDKYGLIEYTLSFDLRASQAGQVAVYQQNGSGSKYSGLWKNLTVTTEWQRFHVTFTPTEGTVSLANSYLAFYGTYGTGVKPIIRRAKIERGAIATDWSPAPEDQQSYADTKIAEYKTTVDGRFATLQSQKANQVDLQTVRETVNLYERIIGSTETGIKDKVARMVMTDSLFLTEVKDKISGTATQVSQLNNSYAIKNLTSAGTVLNQINLLANGTNRIDGRLTHITGQTLIDNGVIKNAMIGELDAGKITSGTVDAARIKANSIDGSKIAFDEAFFNGLSANQAYLKKLFAKDAFLTAVQAVTLSASKISGGILTATNKAMEVNLNAGQILYYTDQAALKRVLNGYPTQFVKFATGTVTGKGNAGVTVIGSNRWNSESSNDGGFVGIRAWNGANIDQIDVVGDTVRLASSAFEAADGWNINTLPGKLDIDAFNAEHRASSKIKVGDLWLWKNATTYSSMRDTINLIIDNLQLLHNNKSTERGYSYTLPAKV